MVTRTTWVTGLTLMLVALSSVAWSQVPVKKVRLRPIASVNGKDVYQEYCSHCHGDDGKGHGPNSVGLRVPPADLTTIAVRHGGKFAVASVEESINGWHLVPRTMRDFAARTQALDKGQGIENAPVMPVFGPIFARLYPDEIRDRRIRMTNLIAYLKSLQVQTAPAEKLRQELAKDLAIDLQADRPGMLARAFEAISRTGVNIEGYAEVGGTLHVLTPDPQTVRQALDRVGVRVRELDVLVLAVENRLGVAASVFQRIADAGVNVSFSYVAADNRLVIGADDVRKVAELDFGAA